MKKIGMGTIAGAIAAVAAIAGLAWAFSPRPVDVEGGVAERTRFEESIEEDGRTRLPDRYTVSAPVASRMARITLREGDIVRAGDAVAVLQPLMPAMVDERTLREASARLKAADASLAVAAARLERARVAQDEARIDLRRTEQLARDGFVAASRLDSTRLALAAASRELEVAQAAREVATQERAQAAAVLQPVQPGSDDRPLVLRSPISGVVLKVPARSEATITPGTALLDIGDPGRLEVVAEMLTTDAVRAQPGATAVVERWGGPAVPARVRRVEPAAYTKVSALGIEEQRVNVLLDVTDPPALWSSLGDGFRVTVRIITLSIGEAIVVPVGALFPHADGGMAVYRIEDGRARLRVVELGGRNANVGWVKAGLQAGDAVIVYPPATVEDGKRVRIRRS